MRIHYLAAFLLAGFGSQGSCYNLQPWVPQAAPPQNPSGGSRSHSTVGVHNTVPERKMVPDERNIVRYFQQMSDNVQESDEEGLLKLLGMLHESTHALEADLAELRAIEDTCKRKVAQAKQNSSKFKIETWVPPSNKSPSMSSPQTQTGGTQYSFVDSLAAPEGPPEGTGSTRAFYRQSPRAKGAQILTGKTTESTSQPSSLGLGESHLYNTAARQASLDDSRTQIPRTATAPVYEPGDRDNSRSQVPRTARAPVYEPALSAPYERAASRGARDIGQTVVKPAPLSSQGGINSSPVPANRIAQVDEWNSVQRNVQSDLSSDGNVDDSPRLVAQQGREYVEPFVKQSGPASLSLGQSRLFSTAPSLDRREGLTARLHKPSVPVYGATASTEQNPSYTSQNNPGPVSTNDHDVTKLASLSQGYSKLFRTTRGSPVVSRGQPGTPKAFVFGE